MNLSNVALMEKVRLPPLLEFPEELHELLTSKTISPSYRVYNYAFSLRH